MSLRVLEVKGWELQVVMLGQESEPMGPHGGGCSDIEPGHA